MKTGVALIFAGFFVAMGLTIIGYSICQILMAIGFHGFIAFTVQVIISMIGVVIASVLWYEAFQVME